MKALYEDLVPYLPIPFTIFLRMSDKYTDNYRLKQKKNVCLFEIKQDDTNEDVVYTPEWVFYKKDLKRLK